MNRLGQDLLLLQRKNVDRQGNELKPLKLALPASFRVGDKCCHHFICNHCFNSCNELCKQGTVWAMPAGGTADPYLVLKASNLLLLALTTHF